ncbi:molybdate ABC transporter substrate-binding protein [Thioclava sp. A2]|uniref:molybdate ABC transporter substrate-binding protein n=1 Tax=Thioclava sp. FCG-A2 TaxID=3080562 RepID=UPI0029550A09|nr:molybdate ABC transporter substrate-binding protein [Thioclava sp. A2]MDV7270017.1 molybdate ABC transporter substrate-binding protein [Thioclava sp. A2]
MRLLPLLLSLALPVSASAETITVFAAASLKTALDRVAREYELKTGDRVAVSYAGSGALARQILQGAPADIFISANTDWMDAVAASGWIATGSRHDLLGNTLVLVAHPPLPATKITPATDLVALANGGRIATGLVEAVPVGQYAKIALQSLDLWEKTAPYLAQTDNARTALALVAAGEAPLGVVYATDARAEPRVHVIATFPEGAHPPITYPAALAQGAPHAAGFFDALSSPGAAAIFAAEGFAVKGAP